MIHFIYSELYTIEYTVYILIIYLLLRNHLYVLLLFLAYIFLRCFLFDPIYSVNIFIAYFLGSLLGTCTQCFAKLSQPHYIELQMHIIQLFVLSIVFLTIDTSIVIEQTQFAVGYMLLYLFFVVIWFIFYFINMDYKHPEEHNDSYLIVFLISSAMILLKLFVPILSEMQITVIVTIASMFALFIFNIYLQSV